MGQGASCVSCADSVAVAETRVSELSQILKELKKPGLSLQQKNLLILRSAKITEELHKSAAENIVTSTRSVSNTLKGFNARKNVMNRALNTLPGQPSDSEINAHMDRLMSEVALSPVSIPASLRGGEKKKLTRRRWRHY
jgi:hypothetical protein